MDSKQLSRITWHPRLLIIPLLLMIAMGWCVVAYGQPPAEPPRNTGVQEDVNEFLGYEDLLLVRYLSLPYDTVMNTNVMSYFVDISFLLIIFIPLIFLNNGLTSWIQRLGFLVLCLLFLLLSVPSAYLAKERVPVEQAVTVLDNALANHSFSEAPLLHVAYRLKMPFVQLYAKMQHGLKSITGPQDYLTYPILFLLLIPVFLLLDSRIRHHSISKRSVIYFLLLFCFLWLLLSSGITWYGLLMIPLLFVLTVAGMSTNTSVKKILPSRWAKGLLLSAVSIWLLIAFAYRFANYQTANTEIAKYTYMAAMTEYQIGRKDLNNVYDRTFPQYRQALQSINQEDESYIYRVGTILPFFIEKNDRRIFSDNFLDFFTNLRAAFPDKRELTTGLKAYGFRYLIVDLNLAVNDHTVEGSLRNKFEQFSAFLYQNPQLQLIATDRILRTNDGKLRFGVFPDSNTAVENLGYFAVYQIN